jgi:RNA polymerase-binding transcription factor
MDAQKLDHFRSLLLQERQRIEGLRADQTPERVDVVEEVDAGDLSHADLDKDIAFNLGERETNQLHEIDDALRRLDEGTYGICEQCRKPIDERRLEAIPTARYHAECQAELEATQGLETPTL